MGLQQIGPHEEGPSVRQRGERHLQLDPFIAKDCPILTQDELKGLSLREHSVQINTLFDHAPNRLKFSDDGHFEHQLRCLALYSSTV